MYLQREKEDNKKTTKAHNVIRKKTLHPLEHDPFAHHPNGLLQRQAKARISAFAARPFLPSSIQLTNKAIDDVAIDSSFNSKEARRNISITETESITPNRAAQIAGARFHEIISSINGKVVKSYSALDNGPLSAGARTKSELNDSLAATFSGGRYAEIELADDLVVYRAWHPDQAREFGAFWSLEKPAGSLQTRIDSALLPEWGKLRNNPVQSQQATQYTEAAIPKGTRIYIGEVSSQGGPWVGSGSQLLIKGGTVLPEWKTGGGLLK